MFESRSRDPSCKPGSLLASIKTAHATPAKVSPINTKQAGPRNYQFPLTPPLTPPSSVQFSNPTTSIPKTSAFATQSQMYLHNYPLHPEFAKDYTLLEELGCGGFGFVVKAYRNSDNMVVAVKFIQRNRVPTHGWAVTREWKQSTRGLLPPTEPNGGRKIPMEVYILAGVHLEGVVAFIELFEDEKYFYLVMEHHGSPWQTPVNEEVITAPFSAPPSPTAPKLTPTPSLPLSTTSLIPPAPAMARRSSCDLFECIEQHSRLSEGAARYIFAQIVEIVYQLQKIGVCHRDIKDENVVISKDLKVKLIDFGSAVIFDPSQPLPLYTRFYGTGAFAAAEILTGQPYYAPACEVWALGVLLSILVTGQGPFPDADAAKTGRVSRPRVKVSWEVEELIQACVRVDVAQRASIGDIRNCRWLRGALDGR